MTVLPLTSDLYDMPSIRVTVGPGEGTRAAVAVAGEGGQGDDDPACQGWHPPSLMENWTQKNRDPGKS